MLWRRWDDLGSDVGMAHLCVSGVAGWYLRAARSAEESGHPVPDGAVMECNLEYLYKYKVRLMRSLRLSWASLGFSSQHQNDTSFPITPACASGTHIKYRIWKTKVLECLPSAT